MQYFSARAKNAFSSESKVCSVILTCLLYTSPEIPDLSLGTVYRNIALFKDEGKVRVICNVNGEERIDGNTCLLYTSFTHSILAYTICKFNADEYFTQAFSVSVQGRQCEMCIRDRAVQAVSLTVESLLKHAKTELLPTISVSVVLTKSVLTRTIQPVSYTHLS